jgi:hypothetical protein
MAAGRPRRLQPAAQEVLDLVVETRVNTRDPFCRTKAVCLWKKPGLDLPMPPAMFELLLTALATTTNIDKVGCAKLGVTPTEAARLFESLAGNLAMKVVTLYTPTTTELHGVVTAAPVLSFVSRLVISFGELEQDSNTAKILQGLSNFPALRSLTILDITRSEMTSEVAKLLTALPNLQSLVCYDILFLPAIFAKLPECPSLTTFCASSKINHATDKDVGVLTSIVPKCPKLVNVSCSGNHVSFLAHSLLKQAVASNKHKHFIRLTLAMLVLACRRLPRGSPRLPPELYQLVLDDFLM